MVSFLKNTNKTVVGIAVTQNVGLEVGIIDGKTNQMIKYASRPLEYNIASREIDNYTVFKSTLEELYEELGVEAKHDAYIVLPNVHFDFTNLPIASMSDENVAEHILNKIEESNFIFRRVDPMTGWDDINFRNRNDSRYIVHSSLQAQACEQLKNIIQEMGGNLIGVEGAYTAILRGIEFSGIADEYIESGEDWTILLINSNSYILFTLNGRNLIDYAEFPLALRSLSAEEAYQAIANPVSQHMSAQTARRLLIVSQSDEISANILRNSLEYSGEILSINSNKYADVPIISGQAANHTTLSLVGACSVNLSKFPLKLNALYPRETIASTEVDILGIPGAKIRKISIILIAVLIVLWGVIFGSAFYTSKYYETQNEQLTADNQRIQAEIDALKGDDKANINAILNTITEQNLKTMAFYNSLAVDIPKTVWLSRFESRDGNQIFVEGMSTNIKDVYRYYKTLKLLVPSSSVTLSKLKMVSNLFDTDYSIDNMKDDIKLYSFAIGSEISAAPPVAAPGADGAQNPQAGGAQQKQQQTNNVDSVPPDVNLQPINDEMFN